MQRREFITLLGGAAAATSIHAAHAQQPRMPVVGFLNGGSSWESALLTAAFIRGLGDGGFAEGRNVLIEYRWAEGHYDRLATLAADLVRRRVTVIAAIGGPPQALAAKAATTTIPIIFQVGADPVALGLVASLNRPGGNITGVTSLNLEVGPKRLELMQELLPAANLALLVNPTNPINAEAEARDLQTAARTFGRQLDVLRASNDREIDEIFAILVRQRAGGLIVGPDPFLQSRTEQIATLAMRHGLPAISPYREFAVAGGLMSYGGDLMDSWRRAGDYTGRILKGEKSADLPVQQATRVELIINMKTAKAFGLTFPLTLLGRADEVIE